MASLLGLDGVLRAIGTGYWLLMLVLVFLAMYKSKTWSGRLVLTSLVLVLFIGPIAPSVYRGMVYQERLAKAQALFDERCKTAGEKIYKTAEDVDGLVLKIRPLSISDSSQFDHDDQYGYNVGGEEYIRYYLIGSATSGRRFKFVEVEIPEGKFRYSTPMSADASRDMWMHGGGKVPLDRNPIQSFKARYDIEWLDISSPQDRDAWIAGGSIQIIDRATGEIVAERRGYLMEPGQGSRAGERSPWSWARHFAQSCPSVKEHNRVFVEKVLKPTRGG